MNRIMTEFKRNEDGIIELPKQYDYEEVNNVYRVSNHTARYIELYQKVQDLWGEIYSLVETEYVYEKPETLDDFFDKHYGSHLLEVLDALTEGARNSIMECLGTKDSKVI